MRHSIGFAIIAGVLSLGACGGDEAGEGGVTAEESQQLNEAAEMLDTSPDGLTATDETGLGNGEAPAGNDTTGSLPVADEPATNVQ